MKNMRINDYTYNIVMEEEPPSGYDGNCKCNLYDSSDSISSSETYIEESLLSVKSCEEELRQWGGECSRSKGVEDDGQPEAGSTEGAHTTKTFFKETPIGSSDSRGKVILLSRKRNAWVRRL